ncbi:MAG: HEAT repeat domain-containing protein [Planctomycetes bacterium]|nr:HEAT repeat domain-containing protein [Planctomycetota bacterium]
MIGRAFSGRMALVLVAAAAFVFGGGSTWAQGDDRAQILDWYRKAFEAYDNGDYDTAAKIFEQIMHADPTQDVAMEIREKIMQRSVHTFVEMLQRGGTIGQFSEYILQKSNLGGIERVTDPAQIQTWVKEAVQEAEFEKRWAALIKLDAKVGPYATPYFVPYFLSNNENFKVNAIVSLRHMGEQMTLAVMEILNAADPELRRTAAIVLGHLKDHRALPALARVAQNPNEDRIVVRYAEEAIVNTAGQEVLSIDFKAHYLRLARQFYHHDPSILVRIGSGDVVWWWNEQAPDLGSKLSYSVVPVYLYNEVEAERACWAVLDSDPKNVEGWALLISTNFAKVIETEKILDAVRMSPEREPQPSQSEMEMLEKNQQILTKADALARSAGLENVYAALDMAIKDRRTEVGVHCIKAISEMENRYTDPGKPILSALHTSDKRLRYHAALALVRIDSLRAYAGHKDVVPTLEAALGEFGQRSILVITDDEVARNTFAAQLDGMGYAPAFAETGWDGVERAKRFPSHDLIILDTRIGVHPIDVRTGRADDRTRMNGGEPDDPTKSYEKGIYYITVLEFLERDYKTKEIPVVLLVDPDNEESVRGAAGVGKHANRIKGFISRPVSPDKYSSLLPQIFEGIQDDFKKRSTEIATWAAMALASMDPDHCIYKAEEASNGLLGVLDKSGPELDGLRIAAISAVSNIGHPRALPSLQRVFQDAAGSIPLRVAAAEAIGVILQRNNEAPSLDLQEAFQAALQSEPLEIQVAVAHALGRARIDAGVRWNYYRSNPVPVLPPEGGNE